MDEPLTEDWTSGGPIPADYSVGGLLFIVFCSGLGLLMVIGLLGGIMGVW